MATKKKNTVKLQEFKAKTSRTNSQSLFKPSGVRGEGLVSSYRNEEQRIDDLGLEDYRRMLDDSQVNMLWNAITGTIMSAGFEVIEDPNMEKEDLPESEDKTEPSDQEDDELETQPKEKKRDEESSEERDFIEQALFASPENGGMLTSFDLVTKNMLRAFVEGYRLFELVYKKEEGKITLKKISPRSGRKDVEIHIKVDDNGDFLGFTQKTYFMNKMIDVEVVNNSEIKKVIKVTFGEEFGSLYGRSGFKAAAYDWQMARKGMYLNHIGHELGAVKLRNLKLNGQFQESEVDELIQQATKIGPESVWASNPEQVELVFEDVSDANVMAVGLEQQNLHLSRISKSILAQFIDLGSVSSDTGSRALGESQTTFFKQGLESVAKTLVEEPWNQIIASLIKANFPNGSYPKIKIKPIADDSVQLLLTVFTELVKKGNIPDIVKNEVLLLASNELGLDVREEEIEREMSEKKKEEENKMQMEMDNAKELAQMKVQQAPVKASEVKLNEVEGYDNIVRPLYPDEQKVKLADIKRKMINTENDLEVTLRRKLGSQRDEIVNMYLRAARDGSSSIGKVPVKLAEFSYGEELFIAALGLLEYGKIVAANELNVAVPVTTNKQKDATKNDIDLIVEDQQTRLRTRLVGTANVALEAKLPENEAKIRLDNEFDNFFSAILTPTIGLLVGKYLNKGRGITFGKYSDMIFAYRYTAIIDDRTTEYCRELDGQVFQETDPDYIMLTPPNHFGCRSVWTPVTKEEAAENDIAVTGLPSGDFPVFASVSTFKDVTKMADRVEERDKEREIEEKLVKLIELNYGK